MLTMRNVFYLTEGQQGSWRGSPRLRTGAPSGRGGGDGSWRGSPRLRTGAPSEGAAAPMQDLEQLLARQGREAVAGRHRAGAAVVGFDFLGRRRPQLTTGWFVVAYRQ